MYSQIKETRIMDMSVFPIDTQNGLHILAAAYSDSTTRVNWTYTAAIHDLPRMFNKSICFHQLWLFDEAAKKFSLIADGVWHMKCLLQIRHLLLPGEFLTYPFFSVCE
jgi:hypothetical protein